MHVRPVAGDTEDASVTVPVKPPVGVMVIVEVPDAPATTVTLVGLAEMVKSASTTGLTVTVMVTLLVCVEVPIVAVPVITTV